jgi:hypothetical protein
VKVVLQAGHFVVWPASQADENFNVLVALINAASEAVDGQVVSRLPEASTTSRIVFK